MGREIPIMGSDDIQGGGGGPGAWGTSSPVTISGGVITLGSSKIYVISSESGVSDTITSISAPGLNYGDEVILTSATGHSITITKGTFLKMPIPCFLDNIDDELRLRYIGSDTFREVVRVSNS